MDTNKTTTAPTATARIVNAGKRKFIPALEVTMPNGDVEISKGNRAVNATVVAIRAHVDTPDAHFFTAHARLDLVADYSPTGRARDRDRWILVDVARVEQYEG